MKKKITDIISPHKNENKAYQKTHKSFKLEIFNKEALLKNKNKYFIIFTLILIGIFLYGYFILARVEIKIWPKTEEINLKTKLRLENRVNQPFFHQEIETKVLEIEEIINQLFPATEKFMKESRAEGIIRIYNDYSTNPLTLVPRTRFISADGQLFRTPERVIIPGRRQIGGRWLPGTIDIKVIADQPGEKFNIKPTTFVIPGFLGLARYHKVYGRSEQPMAGGMAKEAIRVSERDLKTAENTLKEKKEGLCFNLLKEEILSKEFNFLKETIQIDILAKGANVEVGTEVENFNFEIRFKCQVLSFKTKDIENFAKELIYKQLPENKMIVPESLIINKSLQEQTLGLEIIVDIYSAINKSYLQQVLVGKSLEETQSFFRNLPEIDRVFVNFWPIWVKSVPEDLGKIKIELQFID